MMFERLTQERWIGDRKRWVTFDAICLDNGIVGKAINRLAAYEDTGLEPEEIPHWIPVSERLPEELGHYLAVVKRIAPDEFGGNGTRIRIMRWLGDDWRYAHHIPDWINQKITETVTHWMYLPKSPEELAITHKSPKE